MARSKVKPEAVTVYSVRCICELLVEPHIMHPVKHTVECQFSCTCGRTWHATFDAEFRESKTGGR